MSNIRTSESAPQEGASTRKPWRALLIGGGVTVAVAGLVAAMTHLPAANKGDEIQAPVTQSASSHPTVGDTAGYNITNESGSMLIYQSVAGHVAAPPLQPGGAWLPGQTLNFQLNTGTFGDDTNTGDALFEAYTVGGPNGGTDAGTVDIHFRSQVSSGADSSAWAYLNPLDTAPLVASSNETTAIADGETWTIAAGGVNVITSNGSPTYSVPSAWNYSGVTASQLLASVKAASGSVCWPQGDFVTQCDLGGTNWQFSTTF